MYCPQCQSEYREGFTRCGTCEVDLVASLDSAAPSGGGAARLSGSTAVEPGLLKFVDYCGFLELDEARHARDQLAAQSVLARISIREHPIGHVGTPVEEEYWLRVEHRAFSKAAAVLGYDAVEEVDGGGTTTCSACGETVGADETFCAHCGARFEAGP